MVLWSRKPLPDEQIKYFGTTAIWFNSPGAPQSGRMSISRCQEICDDPLVSCLDRWPHPVTAGFHDNLAAGQHGFHRRAASNENPRIEPFITMTRCKVWTGCVE